MNAQKLLAVLKRRWTVSLAVLIVGLVALYSVRNAIPSTFFGVSHVVLVTDSGARDPSLGIVDLPSVATSTVVLQRVYNTLKPPGTLVDLKGRVSATVLGHSSIMAIGARDVTADRAIAIANGVADELSRYYNEISTRRYNVNVDRLSAELRSEGRKIRAIDLQMGKLTASDPFVVSDRSIDSITEQIANVSAQRAVSYATLVGDKALAQTYLPNDVLSKTARHEILTADPAYTATRSAVGAAIAQLISDRAVYTRQFPGLAGEIGKIANESRALRKQADRALRDHDAFSAAAATAASEHARQQAVVTGDNARVQQLDQLLATARYQLKGIPQIGSEYSELSARRNALQTEYDALATRRANALADRAEAASLGSVVVMDRAIAADTQLAGGRSRAAVVAAILLIALAVGAALLVDSLDPRIRRAEQLEQVYGVPVVANFVSKQ